MSTLYITEYITQGLDMRTVIHRVPQEGPMAQQTVAIGAASVASAVLNAKTTFARLMSDVPCSFRTGTGTPTAVATDALLMPGFPAFVAFSAADIAAGVKIAVITNAAAVAAQGGHGTASQAGANTRFRAISAATTNATSIKASAGNVYGVNFTNTAAAAKFVKLYNKASAPTVGTDPTTDTFTLPANTTVDINWPLGKPFPTGIALAITNLAPDSDATAVAAGDVIAGIDYQ